MSFFKQHVVLEDDSGTSVYSFSDCKLSESNFHCHSYSLAVPSSGLCSSMQPKLVHLVVPLCQFLVLHLQINVAPRLVEMLRFQKTCLGQSRKFTYRVFHDSRI